MNAGSSLDDGGWRKRVIRWLDAFIINYLAYLAFNWECLNSQPPAMNDSFGETVSPVAAIRAILHDYPFSASILRELLQNSDDARATKQVRAMPFTTPIGV